MIIARLQGGLGNQLFQYAAVKALANRLQAPFKLETFTSLQKDKLRNIALTDMHTKFELATMKEVQQFVFFPALYRHKPSFLSKFGRNIYREPHFQFDEKFFHLKDPVFLDGFWQSAQYFKDIETGIREDFSAKTELVKNVIEKGKEMEQRSSVAIHVRRGDFLRPKAIAYHGALSPFYYEKAIGLIRERVPGVFLYFFSDDINWIKQNLVIDKNAQIISSDKQSAIEDFYLMTKCRHNIIANSSFSWWTAWLNNYPGKLVIAPKTWFAGSDIITDDLIPKNWIRV